MPVASSAVAEAVLSGLTRPVKRLPPWLFYDEAGSRLFERCGGRTQHRFLDLPPDDAAVVVFGFDRLRVDAGTKHPGVGRHLTVSAAPQQRHVTLQPVVELAGAGDERRSIS